MSENPAPPTPPPVAPPEVDRPRIRFSLKAQLWFVTGFAIFMGLAVSLPQLVVGLIVAVLITILPALLTIGVVYGRDDIRAFSIGGLFPAGSAFRMHYLGADPQFLGQMRPNRLLASSNLDSVLTLAAMLLPLAVAVFVSGYLCVWARRILVRRRSE